MRYSTSWLNNKIEAMLDKQVAHMVSNVERMALLKLSTEDDNAYLDE